MTRNNSELARDALEHFAVLRRHLERGDLADETIADAVSMRLSAAIEALSRTGESFRTRVLGSEWRVMWATRNRIAHGYAHVDLEMIRSTVEHDIPEVERRLRAEIA